MVSDINYVDLSKVELTPAYDLEIDASIMSFRTPGIPWLRCAWDESVITLYYFNSDVHIHPADSPDIRFRFKCTEEDKQRLLCMYVEGLNDTKNPNQSLS